MPEVGDPAPDFALSSTEGNLHLRDLVSKGKLLLSFYFEDSTPLCSSELSVFKQDYDLILELGARVIAISADSLESHQAFAARLGGLPFPLASDEKLDAAKAYGVVDESGKRSRRAVFVIGGDGTVLYVEPWFQPGNPAQYEAIFRALGMEG